MSHTVSVQPDEQGWTLSAPSLALRRSFPTGRAAELAARRIGERRAEQGEFTEIRIHLKDGRLAARFICAPHARPRTIWETSSPPSPSLQPA